MTLFLTLWAAVGPMAGILIGHYLTKSWQREEWLLDNRRQEYREVLSAITAAYMAIVHIDEMKELKIEVPAGLELEAQRAQIESFRTLRDRILIADEIEFANTLVEWDMAIRNLTQNHDVRRFATRFSTINQTLVDMARVPVSRPNFLRRFTRRSLDRFALWRAR